MVVANGWYGPEGHGTSQNCIPWVKVVITGELHPPLYKMWGVWAMGQNVCVAVVVWVGGDRTSGGSVTVACAVVGKGRKA